MSFLWGLILSSSVFVDFTLTRYFCGSKVKYYPHCLYNFCYKEDSAERYKVEWNSLVLYVTLCHDSRKLLMNVTARGMARTRSVLQFCKAHCAVKSLCCTTAFKHGKDVDSEWVVGGRDQRGRSVMVPFLLHSRRTAGGAERSPTDLVESKGRVGGETTKKKKRGKEKERAGDGKCLIYTALQFGSMDRFSSREGLLFCA